jgi:hypothetical protein
MPMPTLWESHEIAVALPLATARVISERARRFDLERGSRLDARRRGAAEADVRRQRGRRARRRLLRAVARPG